MYWLFSFIYIVHTLASTINYPKFDNIPAKYSYGTNGLSNNTICAVEYLSIMHVVNGEVWASLGNNLILKLRYPEYLEIPMIDTLKNYTIIGSERVIELLNDIEGYDKDYDYCQALNQIRQEHIVDYQDMGYTVNQDILYDNNDTNVMGLDRRDNLKIKKRAQCNGHACKGAINCLRRGPLCAVCLGGVRCIGKGVSDGVPGGMGPNPNKINI